jgi:hypothetical protein
MSDLVHGAIRKGLAGLTTTSTVPRGPFGYGSDLWCENDLHPRMEEVADSVLVIAQYAIRRLSTPPGSLPDDPEWGLDLSAYCNRPTTAREFAALEGEVESELIDDDRVDEVRAHLSSSGDGGRLFVRLRIAPADSNDSFTLTLSVSPIGALIEELST